MEDINNGADFVETIEAIFREMDRQIDQVEEAIRREWKPRKEAVFLPWKASCWKAMEGVWKAAMEDPEYEVSVVPLPWAYRDGLALKEEIHCETDLFPSYVPVTDYQDYDFGVRKPTLLFIQNPYDETNITTSVLPDFYSGNLVRFTENLVYIPWFVTDEIDFNDPEDGKAVRNMRYYVTVPGVVHSDLTVTQSPLMRKTYIEVLTQFAGEDTRSVWERKIQGFGSPLASAAPESASYDEIPASPIWGQILDCLGIGGAQEVEA